MVNTQNPTVAINNVGRTFNGRLARPHKHTTTYNSGDFVPLFCKQVLPDEDLSIKISHMIRTVAPPLRQTLDYSVQDYYAFYVSMYNICSWSGPATPANAPRNFWTRFMGESKEGQFVRTNVNQNIRVPEVQVTAPFNDPSISTALSYALLSEYFGDCLGSNPTVPLPINVTPFHYLAYRQCWNEFVRDWNFQPELDCTFPFDSSNPINLPNYTDWTAVTTRSETTGGLILPAPTFQNNMNSLLPVNKLIDYYTRQVPSPQKYSGVLTMSQSGLPIFTGDDFATWLSRNQSSRFDTSASLAGAMVPPGNQPPDGAANPQPTTTPTGVHVGIADGTTGLPAVPSGTQYSLIANNAGVQASPISQAPSPVTPYFTNLYAGRVNTEWLRELERCYLLWQLYEIHARSPLYQDIIENTFGIRPSNESLNRPTMLGHLRFRVTPTQVENVGENSNLGDIGAFVKVRDDGFLFSHKFRDHGILLICSCIRPHLSYSQGVHRERLKVYREEFFTPILNNLPYQPTYLNEIYGSAYNYKNTQPTLFGWRPAWDEYQFFPDRVSGMFRPQYGSYSLAEWTYTEYYTQPPVLSSDFLVQTPVNIDRTLSATCIGPNAVCHQFMHDILIEMDGQSPVSFHVHDVGRKV